MNKIIYLLSGIIAVLIIFIGAQQITTSDYETNVDELTLEIESLNAELTEWDEAVAELDRLTENDDRCYSTCMEQYYIMDDYSGICRCYATEYATTGTTGFTTDPVDNKALSKLME